MKFREAAILSIAVIFALFLALGWYETMLKVDNLQDRVRALELEARPLVVIQDRWNRIYLNGKEVMPEEGWEKEKED